MTDQKETENLNNLKRIIWHSNAPWANTGYGNQTSLIVPRLQAAGYDMALSAFYGLEGGMQMMDKIPVFPRGRNSYGSDVIGLYSQVFKADIAITLIDAWVLNSQMVPPEIKWVPYYPVDSAPIPKAVFRSINTAFDRIVMSKFGQMETNHAGLSCHYVPHGVDTKVAYHPEDMKAAREGLQKTIGWDPNAFIIGMVAANNGYPARKSFESHLRAFAHFKQKHADAQFYLHTNMNANNEQMAINIPELVQFLGLQLGKDVFIADPANYWLGYPADYMRMLYSSFDVHVLASMGEGFGIPIVEAQACGCPVIVGDWTAMPELCFSGWKIPESETELAYQPTVAYQYQVKADAIREAYEQAYEVRGNQDYRDRARDGARQYDIDRVVEKYWLPTLKIIGERIQASK